MFDTDDGQLTVVPVADYRRVIAERVSPMSKGQTRDDALISADFLSTDISVTKVRLRIHDKVFVDHLNWAYVDGSFMHDCGQALARHIDCFRVTIFVRSLKNVG